MVVLGENARLVLNAAKSGWGSLLEAFEGLNGIYEQDGAEKGEGG